MEQLRGLNSLLKTSVEERTVELQLAQEILDVLPRVVVGISQECEVVLTNSTARLEIESLRNVIPGNEAEECLPQKAADRIQACLDSGEFESFEFEWDDRTFLATLDRIGSVDVPRGCVLLLEDKK